MNLEEAVGRLYPSVNGRLGLSALTLPPTFRRAEGQWQQQPAVLTATAHAGPGIRFSRATRLWGPGLEIHNLLWVPDPGLRAPLVGVDVVDVGRPELVVVADASWPTAAGAQAAPSRFPPPGPLPQWCGRFFSPTPLFARVTRAQLPAAWAEMEERVALLGEAVRRGEPALASAASWQQDYLDAHRTEDRGLLLLHTIFDPAWARSFLEQVLFPTRIGDRWSDLSR